MALIVKAYAARLRLDPGAFSGHSLRLVTGIDRQTGTYGCTEGTLRAHGFTVSLLARIVRDRLAVARPEIVKAGGRTLSMLRLTITDAGRQALAGMQQAAASRLRHGSWRRTVQAHIFPNETMARA